MATVVIPRDVRASTTRSTTARPWHASFTPPPKTKGQLRPRGSKYV